MSTGCLSPQAARDQRCFFKGQITSTLSDGRWKKELKAFPSDEMEGIWIKDEKLLCPQTNDINVSSDDSMMSATQTEGIKW